MLSSITPLGERGRGNRWGLTVGAHIIGSALGGAAIGAGLGTLGFVVSKAIDAQWLLTLPALVAGLGLVGEIARGRAWLPTVARQVDDTWMWTYRGWVYGFGFGVQLGLGAVTIITSGLVHLTGALAVALADPIAGALVGLTFGTVRGATVLATARVNDPSALVRSHRLHQRLQPAARTGTIACQVAVGASLVVI